MSVTLPAPNPQPGDPVALRQIANGVRAALLGNLTFQGNVIIVPLAITNADSPYELVGSCVVVCNTTAGSITISLPLVASSRGFLYFIKKADTSGNSVTLDGNGAETIDGAGTKVLSGSWATATIYCDGTQWLTL